MDKTRFLIELRRSTPVWAEIVLAGLCASVIGSFSPWIGVGNSAHAAADRHGAVAATSLTKVRVGMRAQTKTEPATTTLRADLPVREREEQELVARKLREDEPASSLSPWARARALGLGGPSVGFRLLRHSPPEEWLKEIPPSGEPKLVWPVTNGYFGRGFGFTRKRIRHIPHEGLDIVAPRGSTIRSVATGLVAYAGERITGYGKTLLIVHADGTVALYGHASKLLVAPGRIVRRGDPIALVGSTGLARGPHLHFELHRHGRPVNPIGLFDVPARPRLE